MHLVRFASAPSSCLHFTVVTWPILPKCSQLPKKMIRIEETNEWRNDSISDSLEEDKIDQSIRVEKVHIDGQSDENGIKDPVDWQSNQTLDKNTSLSIGLGFIVLIMTEQTDTNYIMKQLHFMDRLERVITVAIIIGMKVKLDRVER